MFKGGADIDKLIQAAKNQEAKLNNDPSLKQEETSEIQPEKTEEEKPEEIEEIQQELPEETEEAPIINKRQEKLEEKEEERSPIKKYIFYVSKEFVNIIDSLTIDERTAYINDAIQMKIDSTKEISHNDKISKIITQAIVVFLTVCIMTPIAVFIMNKAIMATFDNYKYSQQNFEKLYKQRFENDKTYMRSVKYNQAQQQNAQKQK